jgi:DNA-binding beta-propeller fold protein YncE
VADSEGSSIRAVPFQSDGHVVTVVGTAKLPKQRRLFTFGDYDGSLDKALLQHPLGVAYHDGRIYVADTYNNKIKQIDLQSGTVLTLAGDSQPGRTDEPARFDEPAGLSISGGKLYVADTNNHLIRVIDLQDDFRVSTLAIAGLSLPSHLQGNRRTSTSD